MSEKSPSIADIWNKHYATQEAFTKAMYKFRNQTIDKVLKIVEHRKRFHIYCENDCYGIKEINNIEEEIKKIHSQDARNQSGQQVWAGRNSLHKEDEAHQSKYLPNSSEGLGVRGSKNPAYPDSHTQNLEGCGEWLREDEDYGFISCGDIIEDDLGKKPAKIILCEKCQGKVE